MVQTEKVPASSYIGGGNKWTCFITFRCSQWRCLKSLVGLSDLFPQYLSLFPLYCLYFFCARPFRPPVRSYAVHKRCALFSPVDFNSGQIIVIGTCDIDLDEHHSSAVTLDMISVALALTRHPFDLPLMHLHLLQYYVGFCLQTG